MTPIRSQHSLTLGLPPSCIAFSPRHPEYFVVGTYYLHPGSSGEYASAEREHDHADEDEDASSTMPQSNAQKRTGSLILFRLREGDDEITQISTLPTDYAVLDLQWSPHVHNHGGEILAVATSTGRVEFFYLSTGSENESTQTALVLKGTAVIAEDSILVLSLAWHPELENVIGVTLSDGSVRLCHLPEGREWTSTDVEVKQRVAHSHELEAWTLAFAPQTPGEDGMEVLSGGDDAVLKFSSTSSLPAQTQATDSDEEQEAEAARTWQDRKIHQAGVTAILPLTAELVVTGSYDDYIRLLSCPKVGRRKVLAEANLGGGVWRLKDITTPDPLLHDQDGNDEDGNEDTGIRSPTSPPAAPATPAYTILASCMHAGARIVRLSKDIIVGANGNEAGEWRFEVLYKFEEHQSMNYGSDVQPLVSGSAKGGERGRGRMVVSTSFYDRLMCLWEVEVPGG